MDAVRQWHVYVMRVWWEQRSYRLALALGVVSSAIGLVQFVLLGKFIQQGGTFPGIEQYGGDVLAFLLTGSVFAGLVAVALSTFSGHLRTEQQTGTLEAVLVTPTSLLRQMCYSGATALVGVCVSSALMIVVFGWLFGVSFDLSPGPVSAVLVLLVLTLVGFGMAGCGFLLVAKRGDPVTWVLVTLTTIFSGVLYPVTILPRSLQVVSAVLPTTAALDGLRRSMLVGSSLADVVPSLLVLGAWCAVAVPGGWLTLRWGLRKASADGTIAEF